MAKTSDDRPDAREDGGESLAYERRACIVSALAGLVFGGMLVPGSAGFPLDDAWIHLSYAKSLRLGEGLSYNPFDWELGFSSPLWALTLTLWPWVGDPALAVKLLGVLFHAATAWLTAALVIEIGHRRATLERPLPLFSMAALSGTLVAAHPILVQGASSGMEVPLATMLAVATSLAVVLGRTGVAAVLGLLATLARPELLIYCVALAVVGGAKTFHAKRVRADEGGVTTHGEGWPRAALACSLGAALALGLWILYAAMRSGQPWPNAQLVKGQGGGLAGLAYVVEEVLPWQPWLVALSGVPLLARVCLLDLRARRPVLLAVLLAAALTVVAIAVSRPLHLGIGFFESRYFAIVAPLPLVALPFGLLGLRRILVALALLPIALVNGLQLADVYDITRAQEQDTLVLHVDVARYLADALPDDAVVGVEGAGANRFWTPRSMTIVDLVGLNDHDAARRHFDRPAKICHFVAQNLTHLAIPEHWLPQFGSIFALRPIARFDDPVYTQVTPPRPMAVIVAEVAGTQPQWETRCRPAD